MATGSIKKIMADKGFGFIKPDDGSEDLFFHKDGVDGDFNDFQEGKQVEFTPESGPKGPKASAVKLI